MIRRTVFPKKNENALHRLDPLIKKQLRAKTFYGGFYDDYDPAAESIDIISARAGATYGTDISRGIHTSALNIPCKAHLIPARRYECENPSGHIVLFLHGGGFTVGSVAHKDAQCRYLAETSRAVIISIDYRLAPENPYPAAVDDAIAALKYCASIPHDRLIIGGDSAGATLAANAIMQSGISVDYAFYLYGAFDLAPADRMYDPWSYSLYECDESEKDLIYSRLNRFRRLAVDIQKLYLSDMVSPDDELVSPTYTKKFTVFPSSLFIIAEFDYYRFNNEAFARRLDFAGVDAEILYYEGLDHGFFDRLGTVPQARECIEEIGYRIRRLS